MSKDYYKTLGVEKGSTKEQIKKAYKKLAMKYHPDRADEDKKKEYEEKFKEINEAASILGDEKKRQHYDQFGTAEPGAGGFGGFGGYGDFSAFADFGDIFDQFFGGSRRRSGGQRGSDLLYELELSLEDAAFGTSTKIVVPRMETCKKCDGTGAHSTSDVVTCSECNGRGRLQRQMRTPFGVFSQSGVCGSCRGEGTSIKRACEYCDGMGRVRESRTIDVKIPAGVDDGMRLRVSGEGEAGLKGAPSGDLFVQIRVKPHDVFERNGEDINIEMPITFAMAALGGDLDVPTLHGKASLKIPEGTQSNTVFRMKGKGIAAVNGYGTGNQEVRVVVEVPTKLTKKQKELIEKFDATKPKRKKGLLEGLF